MAANLNETGGRVSFAYNNRLLPWHGVGVGLPGNMTFAEAVVAGGLDYEVVKRPLLALDNDDETLALPSLRVPGHYATVRTDTNEALGVVGSKYRPIQNRDAFHVFDPLIGEGAAAFDTAGVLGKGERAFILADLQSGGLGAIGNDHDQVRRFLLFVNSHDGSALTQVRFTHVRVVCQNTLQAALAGVQDMVTVRHTAGAKDQMEAMAGLLKVEESYWTAMSEAFAAMKAKDVNREKVRQFVDSLFPGKVEALELDMATEKALDQAQAQGIGEPEPETPAAVSTRTQASRDRVVQLFDGAGVGADLAGSNVWGLYNAATQYIDRERSIRTHPWVATTFGSGKDLRQRALNTALTLLA